MISSSGMSPPLSPVLLLGMAVRALPLAPLQPVLAAAMDSVTVKHPDVFERLSELENIRFLIDPVDLPFGFLLIADVDAPELRAVKEGEIEPDDVAATIRGPLMVLIEMLEGKILEYLEIVELGTKSMSDGLNLNEKILLKSAKKWNNMIDNIESVNRNLAKISSLPAEIKEQKRESREEIEWFKKSLSEESRRYKKELLVSSLKIQAGAALVSILSLGGLFLVFSYLI